MSVSVFALWRWSYAKTNKSGTPIVRGCHFKVCGFSQRHHCQSFRFWRGRFSASTLRISGEQFSILHFFFKFWLTGHFIISFETFFNSAISLKNQVFYYTKRYYMFYRLFNFKFLKLIFDIILDFFLRAFQFPQARFCKDFEFWIFWQLILVAISW